MPPSCLLRGLIWPKPNVFTFFDPSWRCPPSSRSYIYTDVYTVYYLSVAGGVPLNVCQFITGKSADVLVVLRLWKLLLRPSVCNPPPLIWTSRRSRTAVAAAASTYVKNTIRRRLKRRERAYNPIMAAIRFRRVRPRSALYDIL